MSREKKGGASFTQEKVMLGTKYLSQNEKTGQREEKFLLDSSDSIGGIWKPKKNSFHY